MPTYGGHIPDFGWGDPSGAAIIDWGFGEGGVTTLPPSTVPETTTPPVTLPPGPEILGSRIAGGLVYKAGLNWLVGRFWAELPNGFAATAAFQPVECTVEIIKEDGSLLGGFAILGRPDPTDLSRVRFIRKTPGLAVGSNYLARVTLVTVSGEVLGPRTIAMPVG